MVSSSFDRHRTCSVVTTLEKLDSFLLAIINIVTFIDSCLLDGYSARTLVFVVAEDKTECAIRDRRI
jgi:hypothetical protein